MSIDVFLAKTLRIFATCLLVNNNSSGKLVLSFELLTVFDDILKTTSVSFFIDDFNFLSFLNLIALHLNYYIESFLYIY